MSSNSEKPGSVYQHSSKTGYTLTVFGVCIQLMHERALGDNSLLEQRFSKLKTDYENQLMQSDELAGENSKRSMELRRKEEEVQRLKQELTRGNKVRDGLQKRLRSVEEQKADVESNRESLKQQISSLERGTGICTMYVHECVLHLCTIYMYVLVHVLVRCIIFSELENQRRQAEQEKRAYEDIVRERDMLSKVTLNNHTAAA